MNQDEKIANILQDLAKTQGTIINIVKLFETRITKLENN